MSAASASLAELPGWARELLTEGRVAHLGLLDEDAAPRVQPITFALAADRLWTAVDAKPKSVPPERLARVRRLRRDPRAALTVDRYDERWEQLAWVQALGRIELLDPAEAPEGSSALVDKYPQYRGQPPAGPLLALTVSRCLCWRASST